MQSEYGKLVKIIHYNKIFSPFVRSDTLNKSFIKFNTLAKLFLSIEKGSQYNNMQLIYDANFQKLNIN